MATAVSAIVPLGQYEVHMGLGTKTLNDGSGRLQIYPVDNVITVDNDLFCNGHDSSALASLRMKRVM